MRLALILIIIHFTCRLFAQAPLVYQRQSKLVYTHYANEGQKEKLNTIPDFSFAGYKGGGIPFPDVKPAVLVTPQPGDCRELIQQAINKVSALPLNKHGQRGAVVLTKGIFPVDGSLFIKTSGVVLRGEGHGTDGTILIAKKRSRHDFIIVQGEGKGYGEKAGSKRKIIDTYVPTGATSVNVEVGHHFKKGDAVLIQRTPNQRWIDELQMAQYGWTAADYIVSYERLVVAVRGTKIVFNIPVVDPIDEKYGGGSVVKTDIKGRISQCGVENMRLESVFENDNDEEHAWNAVVLKRTENCWVRDVVAKYFGYSCVNISDMSTFATVQDCAMVDPKAVTTGARKYSFNIEHQSTCIFFQRCVSWGGRHDFVTGARVPGPNVFLDCVAENTFADIGPHHRWSTGVLFDNVSGGQLRVQNRKAMGSGHGWAGAQTLFWNCLSGKDDIKVESPVGAMNWAIGNTGLKQQGDGYWENWGKPVEPRSLYLKQLEVRLGAKAVNRITTPIQRRGDSHEQMKGLIKKVVSESRCIDQYDEASN